MQNRILITVLSVLFILPLIFYAWNFQGGISSNHSRWSELGSFLSGIYGTFAFIILAYTTNLTRKQFKVQNEDNVFFKLYESLQTRIINSSISVEENEYTASKTLKKLTELFEIYLESEAVELARILLAEEPRKVAPYSYSKIFKALKGENFIFTLQEDMSSFIDDIESQPDFNKKWDRLKDYISSRGNESKEVREALRVTGCTNFYKIPYEKRQAHYTNVAQYMLKEYGDFLDGYIHNISYLLEFAEKSINKSLYIEFITSQLTKYEVVIIFYLIAGRYKKLKNQNKFYTFGIMNRLMTTECQFLLIDKPSHETMEQELKYIFDIDKTNNEKKE